MRKMNDLPASLAQEQVRTQDLPGEILDSDHVAGGRRPTSPTADPDQAFAIRVFAACDRLTDTGQKISYESVKGALGGGSYRDIAPAFKQWQKQKRPSPRFDLYVPHDVNVAVQRLWDSLRGQAQTLIDNYAAGADRAVDASLQREADAMARLADLADTHRELQRDG